MIRRSLPDRIVGWLSPKGGVERLRYRAILERASERLAYEAASKGRRTDGWRTSGTSANAEIRVSLAVMRARSRALVRDNPWASRAVAGITANVIGTGIVAKVVDDDPTYAAKVQTLWEDWAQTPACDADGEQDFYGLQSLVVRGLVEGGEQLVRRRWRRPEDGLPVPLQVQILEPDFLNSAKDQSAEAGTRTIQGVEFDLLGKRRAYWLFPEHPGELTAFGAGSSKAVPASEILHVYRMDRAGQVRGVPWGSPTLLRLRDFDEYDDAQLFRQKLAACFGGVVNSDTIPQSPVDPETGKRDPLVSIEPGMIQYLEPGESITFADPPSVEGYADYSRVSLRAVAAGYGVPYELLTGDLSQVNFSSGRMGWLEFQRAIDQWRWLIVVTKLLDPVWAWFLEAAILAGKLNRPARVHWTPPRREMIDPKAETYADNEAVRAGRTTLSELIRRDGNDPEQVFEELARERQRLRELDLVVSTDPANGSGKSSAPAADDVADAAPAASK